MTNETEFLGVLDPGRASLSLYTPLDALFAEYQKKRAEIEQIAGYVAGASDVMIYFLCGAQKEKSVGNYTATTMFAPGPAIWALDADFWSRAMKLTDVLELLPAEARNEWCRQIKQHETPPFDPQSVRATLQTLIASRAQFFADRVEGLFFNLSDQHATNCPEGFYKRLIIGRMRTHFGSFCHERCNFVHDLRCVLAKFAGRGEPPAHLTVRELERIHQAGEFGIWHDLDGGAIRLRLFKVGTCHLEVHPDAAHRLNMILAWRNPGVIPKSFRKGRAAPRGSRPLQHGLVHFDVITGLDSGIYSPDGHRAFFPNPVSTVAAEFMIRHGGRQDGSCWNFDYDFQAALGQMERTGSFPAAGST